MVDVQTQLVVHGRDGDVVFQVFGEETAIGHVEAKNVMRLRVKIGLQ